MTSIATQASCIQSERPSLVRTLAQGVVLEQTPDHIHIAFDRPRRVLSSAVLNGGFCQASHYVNMRVPKRCPLALEDPVKTLERYCHDRGWAEATVGMMTAASMKSLRVAHEKLAGESLTVVVTTGLDNARRAGDPAEFSTLTVVPDKVGTINMVILTSANLTDEAMVEMVTVATEAKSAALQNLGVISPVSGELATGTGTDAIAIVAGDRRENNAQPIRFTGKHTLIGERVAQVAMAALKSSINGSSETVC